MTSDVIQSDSSGALSAARLSANTRNACILSWNRWSSLNMVGCSDVRSLVTQPTLTQSPTVRWSIASTTNPTTGQFSGLSAAAFHPSHSSPETGWQNTFNGSSGRPGIPVVYNIQHRPVNNDFSNFSHICVHAIDSQLIFLHSQLIHNYRASFNNSHNSLNSVVLSV